MKRIRDGLITSAAVAAALTGPTASAAWLGRSAQPLPALAPAVAVQTAGQVAPSIDGAALREVAQMGLLFGTGDVAVNNGIDDWQSVSGKPLSYSGGELIRTGPDGLGVLRLPDQGTVFLCPYTLSVMTRGPSGRLNFELTRGTARLIFGQEDAPRIEAANKEFMPDRDLQGEVWAIELNVRTKDVSIMMLTSGLEDGQDVPTKHNGEPWDGAKAAENQLWVVSPNSGTDEYEAQALGYPSGAVQPKIDTETPPDRVRAEEYLCRLPEVVERAGTLALTGRAPASDIPAKPPQDLPDEGNLIGPSGNPPLALAEPVEKAERRSAGEAPVTITATALPESGSGSGATSVIVPTMALPTNNSENNASPN
ncbi:MAG: hypothetical protein GKR94_14605 [Gammaproteobacteria bacterium]|nr:hypothetical protein [Gammaproteobacteria bacterium]